MRRPDAEHFPPHGLEDAHEFFRQGDDGEYVELETNEDPLLADVGSPQDWEQIEHQLERRARYTRWVTGLMVALGLATVTAFVLRSTHEDGSQAGPTSTASAPRLLQPDARQPSPVRPHAAITPRIESAKNEPDSAEHAPAVAASQRSESPQTRAPSVRSSRVRRGSRVQVAPPQDKSTPSRDPEVQSAARPRNAEPAARAYRPPTARFAD